jgi:hypothetical protein
MPGYDLHFLHIIPSLTGGVTYYTQEMLVANSSFDKSVGGVATKAQCGYAPHVHMSGASMPTAHTVTVKSKDTCWANDTRCNTTMPASKRVDLNCSTPAAGTTTQRTGVIGGELWSHGYICNNWSAEWRSDQVVPFKTN